MAYTSTPTPCPTCGALTFGGRVNVKVWTGDNGSQRFYPAGDHAPVCERNMARQAENAAHEAAMAAWRTAEAAHLAMLHRWGARAKAVLEAHPGDEAMAAKAGATVMRLVERTPRPPQH